LIPEHSAVLDQYQPNNTDFIQQKAPAKAASSSAFVLVFLLD
jgi:hypothetical protein